MRKDIFMRNSRKRSEYAIPFVKDGGIQNTKSINPLIMKKGNIMPKKVLILALISVLILSIFGLSACSMKTAKKENTEPTVKQTAEFAKQNKELEKHNKAYAEEMADTISVGNDELGYYDIPSSFKEEQTDDGSLKYTKESTLINGAGYIQFATSPNAVPDAAQEISDVLKASNAEFIMNVMSSSFNTEDNPIWEVYGYCNGSDATCAALIYADENNVTHLIYSDVYNVSDLANIVNHYNPAIDFKPSSVNKKEVSE
jgi:hypothetical protein